MVSPIILKPAARLHSLMAVRPLGSIVHRSTPKSLPIFMNLPGSEGTPSADTSPSLRMLIFGKPCTGKGTLASKLTEKYDIHSVSTGDLLRQHIIERTPIGKEAEEIVANGGLLPDELMLDLVIQALNTLQNSNWILDGFPRTQRQGRLLDNYLQQCNLPLNLVVNVDIPDDVVMDWISDRWVHLPSGRVYSTSYNPPKVPGLDDVTGEPLSKRPDDTPEIFSRRLDHYYAQTSPLLYYYASRSPHATRLVNLDGDSKMLWPTLDNIVRESLPAIRERSPPRPRVRRQMQVRTSL
ncbi:adenylate kinase-domain-containing protein [Scleroderma yunnanense]